MTLEEKYGEYAQVIKDRLSKSHLGQIAWNKNIPCSDQQKEKMKATVQERSVSFICQVCGETYSLPKHTITLRNNNRSPLTLCSDCLVKNRLRLRTLPSLRNTKGLLSNLKCFPMDLE